MLSPGKCGVRVANYGQCAVSTIIVNVIAYVWFDGETLKPPVALQFALGAVV